MDRSIKQNSAFFGKKIGDVIQGNFTNNRYVIAKEELGWDKWSLSVINCSIYSKFRIDKLITCQFKSKLFHRIDEIEEEYSSSKLYLDSRLQSGLLSKEEYRERLAKKLGGSI